MEGIEQGAPVTILDDGEKVNGYVESIQLHPAEKINVRIIHPGHKQHGLIVAFDPDQVTPADGGDSIPASSITKEDLDGFAEDVAKRVNGFESRIAALETIPSALSSVQNHVAGIEGTMIPELVKRIAALEAKSAESPMATTSTPATDQPASSFPPPAK